MCLLGSGGHRSSIILAPPGEPPKLFEVDTDASDADFSTTKFQELATCLRLWQTHLARSGASEHDLRCSPAYLAGWATWADQGERELDVVDNVFSQARGPHLTHTLHALFLAKWLSYKLRADHVLQELSHEDATASLVH